MDNREIAENDYNLSVSSYVTPPSTQEVIDIAQLNAEIAEVVARTSICSENNVIIKELEGGS